MPRSEIDLSEVYSVHHAYGRLSIAQDADHAVVHGTGDQLDTFIDKLNELTGRGDDVAIVHVDDGEGTLAMYRRREA